MNRTFEQRTVIRMEEKVTEVNIIEGGYAVEIISVIEPDAIPEKGTEEYIEKYFPVVNVSSLSTEDEFLKYNPKNAYEENIKLSIIKIISKGLPDFRAQKIDPSCDENENIFYKAGSMPAVGKSATWWYIKAQSFMPEKGSRLGTTEERLAFLALIIKELIKRGYSVDDAWSAVCEGSKNLGHYRDSKEAKKEFELTGSRRKCGWCDLANTSKITVRDEERFIYSKFGGYYEYTGAISPLAHRVDVESSNLIAEGTTGWIVLSV